MLKKLLIAVTVFAVLLMLALSWITARYVDQEEILRAKTEMDRLRATRDSIYAFVAVFHVFFRIGPKEQKSS